MKREEERENAREHVRVCVCVCVFVSYVCVWTCVRMFVDVSMYTLTYLHIRYTDEEQYTSTSKQRNKAPKCCCRCVRVYACVCECLRVCLCVCERVGALRRVRACVFHQSRWIGLF